MVRFEDFRQMLGGIGYVQAQRLLQNKTVKSFKIRGEYLIPKECVIDYVLSPHYADYRQILKAQMALSFSPTHMPRTSFLPSRSMPMAI